MSKVVSLDSTACAPPASPAPPERGGLRAQVSVAVDACARVWHASHVAPDPSHDVARLMAAVEAVLERADDLDALAEDDLERPIERLGELHAVEAIPLLARVCDAAGEFSWLHEACERALANMGEPAVGPLLDARARSTSRDTWLTLDYALAALGVRDPRILAHLLDLLHEDPDLGASLLAKYGDPAALPALEAALERFELKARGEGPFANHAVIELAAAIEDLGGVVSDEGLSKLRRAQYVEPGDVEMFHRAFADARPLPAERVPYQAPPKPGRNDACWCGSGKKYKRCHLRDDA